MTFPSKNEDGGKVTMSLDGYRSEATPAWTNSTLCYARSYMTLGGSDMFKTNRYTACSIAEIRFWRGTQLTEAQVKAFSEEMSETYGVELDGYTTFGVSGQHSKEVHVASGAYYGTDESGFTLPLYSGQTLSGSGTILGSMSAQSGSTISLASTGSPAFTDLTLENGATIKVSDAGAAAMSANSLTVGSGDVVTVDISAIADQNASLNVCTYSSGTVSASNFRVSPDDGLHSFRIVNGTVRLSYENGNMIIIR